MEKASPRTVAVKKARETAGSEGLSENTWTFLWTSKRKQHTILCIILYWTQTEKLFWIIRKRSEIKIHTKIKLYAFYNLNNINVKVLPFHNKFYFSRNPTIFVIWLLQNWFCL
jgi:hypothetical protein